MSSLRICHVIHNTQAGGAETMLREVVRQLADRYEMSVISLLEHGEIADDIRRRGVPVEAMHWRRGERPTLGQLAQLGWRLRRRRPHIVQTWTYHADLCGGLAARLTTRAKVVWNIRHGTLDPAIDSRNVLRSARLCGLLSHWIPSRILINSQAAIPVHTAAGYAAKKLHWIPNGFNMQRFRPRPDLRRELREELGLSTTQPVVGMCGRFHPHKGQDAFVEVAHRVAAQLPEARFLLCGLGCDAKNEELNRWISAAGLQHQFHLLGVRSDMPKVLNALDVLLLPSATEGMPNIVGEALCCGTLAIASDVGDAAQLVGNPENLVAPGDTQALAERTLTLLRATPQERATQAERERARVSQAYDIRAIASRYGEVWERTHAGPAATRTRPAIREFPRRPRLVHITTVPLTPWLFLRGQNAFMAKHGLDVHVISSPGTFLDKLAERDPVRVHAQPISRRIQPLADLKSLIGLFQLLRRLRPDIVQVSTPKAALLGAWAAMLARVPIRIYQVRGLSSESEQGIRRRLYQGFEWLTARLCNGHLVNAASLLEHAQLAGILRDGYVAGNGMSNGVDGRYFAPDVVPAAKLAGSENGPVIGFVGRLTHDKGIGDLEHAWGILRDEFPSARLLLVGPWEQENALAGATRARLEADPRVLLPGLQDDVRPYYAAMDVFAFPSHGTEGFPNAPMEAAAMGLPVVATRVVGSVDAVDHQRTGVLIRPGVPEELTSALRWYLRDAELRRSHGAAGRARVENAFQPELLWHGFLEYYDRKLAEHTDIRRTVPETVSPSSSAAA